MISDVGCELSSRGRRDLRFAIGSILVAITATAPALGRDWNYPDRVRVDAPSFPRFGSGVGGSSGWGGFDTGRPQDIINPYFSPNIGASYPGTRTDARIGCDVVPRGNPITLANANKVERELDFVTSDLEMPLFFERVYNKNRYPHWSSIVPLGEWHTNFEYNLQAQPDGLVDTVVSGPDGRDIVFLKGSDGVWRERKPGSIARITWSASESTFTHYTEAHTTERYRRLWRIEGNVGYWANQITSVRNLHGVGWEFAYDASYRLATVTHTSGKRIQFHYDAAGVSLIDPGGQTYRYNLQPVGDTSAMAEVRYPDGEVRQYHFGSFKSELHQGTATYLLGKSFNGVRYSTFVWKESYVNGALEMLPISTEHAGGVDKWQFDYTFASNGSVALVNETNPLGKKATYVFDNGKVTGVTGHPSQNCFGTMVETTYDTNGYEDVVTEASGRVTNYDYDLHGHLVQKVEGAGTPLARMITFGWDESANRLARITVVGDHETQYGYLANGLLGAETQVDLRTSGVPRRTTYGYTQYPDGILATVTVDGPLQGSVDAVTTSYNDRGDLTAVANGAGHTTTYSNHSPLGQAGRTVDSNGAITDYGYDVRGRIVLVRTYPSGIPSDTHYTYGASGLLEGVQSSDGNAFSYHYDAARRLVQEDMTEPGGSHSVRRTFYNAMSQPTRVEVGKDN